MRSHVHDDVLADRGRQGADDLARFVAQIRQETAVLLHWDDAELPDDR
ncbi:MAG: hypothetical protein ACLP01_24620 [Solirubrobacteraceae bacterium]